MAHNAWVMSLAVEDSFKEVRVGFRGLLGGEQAVLVCVGELVQQAPARRRKSSGQPEGLAVAPAWELLGASVQCDATEPGEHDGATFRSLPGRSWPVK